MKQNQLDQSAYYDKNGEKEADFSSLWRWNPYIFQYPSASHKFFKLLALMLTLSSLSIFALIKIVVFDQNGDAPVVCNLLLQYKRNQRPRNFSIADENWHEW